MKIRYVGKAAIREIERDGERFAWAADVDFVQDVPADLAAELLTYPRPDFVVDASEPLYQLIGPRLSDGELIALGKAGQDRLEALQASVTSILAGMAVAGVGSLEELAGQDDTVVELLARENVVSTKQIMAWVKQARKLMEA